MDANTNELDSRSFASIRGFKHQSDLARSRFEYRELRLARLVEVKARQREERKLQIKDKLNKQSEIQAAIDRASARKESGERADVHKHSGKAE